MLVRSSPLRLPPLVLALGCAALIASRAFAQGGGGNGGAGPNNIGNIINNLPPGAVTNIINNLPAGGGQINLGGLLNGNGTVSSTPVISTVSGLLAGDSSTANVIIPSQALASAAASTVGTININNLNASTNTYLWTISGGTLTSDPTRPSVTYTATTGGTLVLSVAVTVVGSSAVSASANVSVISPALAGKITAPFSVVTGNTTSSASVPAAQNNDRTFRWTVTGDAAIVGSATGPTVNFRPGTPGVKNLTCAVNLQRLVTVTLHSYVVVQGSGPAVNVALSGGSGDGTYPGGSRVDIFADPPAAGQVFDKWVGDVATLGTGTLAASLPHGVITVPATAVTLTATYKAAAAWMPTVVTSFNPQTQTNATGQSTTLTTALAYYIPTGAAGVVFLLHDTEGTAGAWFTTPERALLVHDLVAAGYGVAALNAVNRNTGAWNAQTALANNFDAQNIAAALDKFARDGALAATKPVFLLGEASGADAAVSYAELLTATRPVKGTVLYLSTGSEPLAVTSHVPQLYALAANDERISPAGNATARNNSQLLAGRGVATGATTSALSPVHPGRFRALGVTSATFTNTDATAIWTALKTASYFDPNNYLVKFPTVDELRADLPAAYQARVADVATELSVASAASEFFSENDVRVIAFLNARVAGTPAPAPGRLANLSTLGKIYAVGDSFTLGFTIGGGSERATLLIRGIGPALTKFGLAAALPAPRLEVYQGSTLLLANQGWNQAGAAATAQVTSAAASVGAFALAAGDADSAVVLSNLSPGSYTVTVKGVNGAVGDVLAEVYDVTKNSTRLTNLSTLASINNDGDMLVPGIVIQGANPRTLLIRAVGPGLADFGIPTASLLGDPRITVLNGTTNVATNNNWSQGGANGSAPALTAAFPAVGAFALRTGTNDSALVTSLNAGNFTLQADAAPVAATNVLGQQVAAPNQTGTVLVEVYEVP